MKSRALLAMMTAAALLAACNRQEGRGGLTADEEQQLDNAAAMLDEDRLPSDDSLTQNEAQLDAMGEQGVVVENDANAVAD